MWHQRRTCVLQGMKVSEEGGDRQAVHGQVTMQPVDDKMTNHETVWNHLTAILQGKLIKMSPQPMCYSLHVYFSCKYRTNQSPDMIKNQD